MRVDIDRARNSVSTERFISEQGKLKSQQVTPPGETRELVWGEDFEDAFVDFQPSSEEMVITFTYTNVTTNLHFTQPAFLKVEVIADCDSPSDAPPISDSFEIDLSDEALGGDGVLEPSETSSQVDVVIRYGENGPPQCFYMTLNAAVTDPNAAPDVPDTPRRSGPLYEVADEGVIGTDGGVVYSSSATSAHVNILPGTFTNSTTVVARVDATPPRSYPEDIAAWIQPKSIQYLGSRVEAEFSPAALDFKPDAQFDLLYLVPALYDFEIEGGPTVAAEVRITLPDGSDYVYLDDYTPNGAVLIRNTTLLLAYGSENPGTTRISMLGKIKVSVQPIDFGGASNGGLSPQSAVKPITANYEEGLFRLERDGPFSDSQIRAACSGNTERMPVGRAGRISLPEDKIALVLVHGWQVRGQYPNFGGVIESPQPLKSQYSPALCSWQDFIKNHMNDESYSAGLEQLHQSYELFSFGYDSQKRVADNAREFGTKLRDVFGNQKVVVLAHSMGGLVANTHVQNGGGNVRHLITMGTPYEGSHFVICKNVEGAYCSDGILNMRVIEKAVTADSGFFAGTNYHRLAKAIASFPGTLDLAWQYGGIVPLPEYYLCYQYPITKDGIYDVQRRDCLDEVIAESNKPSEPNPFLKSINSGASYSKHTVFYGNVTERSALAEGFEFTDAFQILSAGAMRSIYGVYSDGIVPISSACRLGSSTGVASNCSGSPFDNLIATEFTHTEIKDAPNMPAYTVELLRVAERLLDIDDGTLDGNQRLYIGNENSSNSCADREEDGICDAAINAKEPLKYIDADFGDINSRPSGDARYVREGEDADGNERFGDGILDMSDFRRWRDHHLMTVGEDAYLNGSSNHVKKDMDGDLGLVSAPVEGILPRWADFNGDGLVSHDDRATVAGIKPTADMPKNQDGKPFLTDLEVLRYTAEQQGLWEDEHYSADRVPNLGNMGDIEIWVRNLYNLPNVVKVESHVDYDTGQNRIHTDDPESQRHIHTVPPGELTAHIYATDKNGNLVLELQKTFDVESGSDALWDPAANFKAELVKTYDSRADDCSRLEGTFMLDLPGLFENGMPNIPLTDENAMMTINQELVAILEKDKLDNEPLEVLAKTIRHCNIERGSNQELGFVISHFDEATQTGFYAHIYDTFDNVNNRWPSYLWNYTHRTDIWINREACPPLTLNVVMEYYDGEADKTQTISGLAPGNYGLVFQGPETRYRFYGLDAAGERVGLADGIPGTTLHYIDEKTIYRGVEQWTHGDMTWDVITHPAGDGANCLYREPKDPFNWEAPRPSPYSDDDFYFPPEKEAPYLYGELRKVSKDR